MEVIVKYKVEEPFKDKNTKEEITIGKVIDISVDRMKELNAKRKGRAIDIIVKEDEITESNKTEENTSTKPDLENNLKITEEELEKMSVNELKEFAEQNKIELTKAKKAEIIEEILSK